MMNFEQIIFNHHSLPFREDYRDIDGAVTQFIDSYNRLRSSGIRTVLIHEEINDLWGKLILHEGKTFGQWLKQATHSPLREAISLFKKSITSYNPGSDPAFRDWPCMSACFQEDDIAAYTDSPVLMAAEKHQTSLLSMESSPVWGKRVLQVSYTWLREQNQDLQEESKSLFNHTSRESISEIKQLILQEKINPDTILHHWNYFFPKINRGKDIDRQIRELAQHPQYTNVLQSLLLIARHICAPNKPTDMHCSALKQLGLDASDESDTTKQKFGHTREFRFEERKEKCYHHLKFGSDIRVHYYVDNEAFHIGYIGSHLPI